MTGGADDRDEASMRAQRWPRRGRRGLLAAAASAAAALCLVVVPASLADAGASFSSTTANAGDAVATAQLQPPSGLGVTQTCTSTPTITHRTLSGGSGTTSLSLAMPAGTTAGDLLVAHVAYRDAPEAITAPGGWTRLAEDTSANVVTSDIYWKFAAASEPTAVFSRPSGAPGPVGGGVVAFIGAYATAPVATSGSATGTGLTATLPSLTTTQTTVEVLSFLTKNADLLPAPSGTTSLGAGTVGTSPTSMGLTALDETFAGPGALPSRSATSTSSTSSEWVAQTVVLRRVPGTPSANLSWTATPSTWAGGYELTRVVGGSTQATQPVSGRTTTSTSDGPLANATSYTYRLTATQGTWRSSAASTTVTTNC